MAGRFMGAFPYQDNVLALPVADIDVAAKWYRECFGMIEVERRKEPKPTVVLQRDGICLGFCVNGADASQDGAAILVSDIPDVRSELEAKGVRIANWRVDERDGRKFQVFFVVAPDGLCYYFHEPL
jgi:catechol 2,3-dioxygenase-like lactoylglutathione lyase family enzyme